MSSYKTPGVYIEEVSLLPASIAQVPTAIPAFIGITEKALSAQSEDLLFNPQKIGSLAEYRELFGGPPPTTGDEIIIDETYKVLQHNIGIDYYLYSSLALFYENGGGDCYIVSIGLYGEMVGKNDFLLGIDTLKKEDEPTLLLAPDLVRLGPTADDADDTIASEVYEVQQQILAHCARMQDRFAILDIFENPTLTATDPFMESVSNFRDNIGINYLNYGAAYTPNIKVNVPLNVNFDIINSSLQKAGGSSVDLSTATAISDVADVIDTLKTLLADKSSLEGNFDSSTSGGMFEAVITTHTLIPLTVDETLDSQWEYLEGELETASALADIQAVIQYLYEAMMVFERMNAGSGAISDGEAAAAVDDQITDTLSAYYILLRNIDAAVATALTGSAVATTLPAIPPGDYATLLASAEWGVVAGSYTLASSSAEDIAEEIADDLANIFDAFLLALDSLLETLDTRLSDEESDLIDIFPVYKGIYEAVRDSATAIPPSGAIAGLYAYVDTNRGVWKAPANVSVAGTAGLSELITAEDQEDLNVDVVSGKSVNAIRKFKGKGNLVWGARTLAGNDNEWRYVPVRRLFINVEESTKKALELMVFEPNDANTWGKVKGMISNFLTGLWREGALAGAKPDQAFYVKVGLGETMTAQDILEGRMIVQIGMAAVRPAEFIILKFMHKMQES